jgi:hypothetical protein
MKYFLLLLPLLLFAGCSKSKITKVTISNLNHEKLVVISDRPTITNFHQIWKKSEKTQLQNLPEKFDYIIDLEINSKSSRFYYSSSTGHFHLLIKPRPPVYKLKQFEKLNTMLPKSS